MSGPDMQEGGGVHLLSPKTNSLNAQNDASPLASIIDITPATAMELLCVNIRMLSQTNADLSENPPGRARSEGPSSGESTPVGVNELHCIPGDDGGQGRDLVQQNLLAKRFVSKRAPPISIDDYLQRLHRFCPMSTAVYLTASLYITRMVLGERVITINAKNMHRLVLASLRVAMKTLEDLSYPHSRVAKVGGVTERELSRLEISFCFLADFELRIDSQMLIEQAGFLGRGISILEKLGG